jgi:hypothetical protein
VVDTVLRSNAVQLIAVDSVAALLPRAEQEGDMGMIQVSNMKQLFSRVTELQLLVACSSDMGMIQVSNLKQLGSRVTGLQLLVASMFRHGHDTGEQFERRFSCVTGLQLLVACS